MGHQTSIASEPGQRPFDHPSPAYDLEAALVVGALDDFQLDRLARKRCFEFRSSVAAVGEAFGDPREQMAVLRIRLAAQSRSWILAGITAMPRSSPIVSTMTLRLMPLVFFAAS